MTTAGVFRAGWRLAVFWATALAFGSWAAPASAAPANRIWVSGRGADAAGCGAPSAPCRSLQFAHDNVAAGGEIDILDPAGYGPVTITKAVSIVNDGVGTAGIQSTHITPGIAIEAGPGDAVYLRGLNLDGQGSAFNGILFFSARTVTVVDCTFRHYLDRAIELSPGDGLTWMLISRTLIADNSGPAIAYEPVDGSGGVLLTLDHVAMNRSQAGLSSRVLSGSTGSLKLTMANSIVTNVTGCGLELNSGGGLLTASIDRSTFDHDGAGVCVEGNGSAHLYRSTLTQNAQGVFISTSVGAILHTSNDNHIEANATNVAGGGTMVAEPPQ